MRSKKVDRQVQSAIRGLEGEREPGQARESERESEREINWQRPMREQVMLGIGLFLSHVSQ